MAITFSPDGKPIAAVRQPDGVTTTPPLRVMDTATGKEALALTFRRFIVSGFNRSGD